METEYKGFKKYWTPKTVLDVVLTPVQPTPTRSHEHARRFWERISNVVNEAIERFSLWRDRLRRVLKQGANNL